MSSATRATSLLQPRVMSSDVSKTVALGMMLTLVGLLGVTLLCCTDLAPESMVNCGHLWQFAVVAGLGVLVVIGVLSQWVFNRADDNLWRQQTDIACDMRKHQVAIDQCRQRLDFDSFSHPISDKPWSEESVRTWQRHNWIGGFAAAGCFGLFLSMTFLFNALDYSGPLVTCTLQACFMFPMLWFFNHRHTHMPPCIAEDLESTLKPLFDSPWFKYHESVLQQLDFWFLVAGSRLGKSPRCVYVKETGHMMIELGDDHCRLTTLLTDDTVVQTSFASEGKINQFINKRKSIHDNNDDAVKLIEACHVHQDAVETVMKQSQTVPICLGANYAKALAYAEWVQR